MYRCLPLVVAGTLMACASAPESPPPRTRTKAPTPTTTAPPATPTPLAAPPAPAPEVPPPSGPSLVLTHGTRRIFAAPAWSSDVVGVTRAGQRLPLRRTEAVSGQPCAGGWFAVAPRGFLCAPENGVIHAPEDPRIEAIAAALPRDADYPLGYGTAAGAARYRRFPDEGELRPHERGETSSSSAPAPGPVAPWLASRGGPLRDATSAYPGMKLGWSRRYHHEGRDWLLTPEQLLVPASRVKAAKPLPSKRFDAPDLPFAVTLAEVKPWVEEKGRVRQLDTVLSAGTVIHLKAPATGQWRDGRGMWATRDGRWLSRAGIALFRKRSPPQAHEAGQKWVHVSVHGGSLVAYEDETPVFAALISPGLGGTTKDHDHRTPPGVYRVGAKWLTSDMSGPLGDTGHSWRTREVPWVAYYDGSYAMHGAWWHDAFGRPRSHGCINLTPPDARHLFRWLDPPLPEGWYAVRGDDDNPGTLLWVTP